MLAILTHAKSFIFSHKIIVKIILFILLFILGTTLVYIFFPVHEDYVPGSKWYTGVDWKNSFRPATLNLYSLRSPYIPGTFNPPWAFIPLLPIALLPADLGVAVMFTLNLFVIALVAHKLGAKPLAIVILLFSPPVLLSSFNCNIDWMVALGLIVPPPIGIFLVLVKPQAGLIIALFWCYQAWKRGRIRALSILLIPVIMATIISIFVYPTWLWQLFEVGKYNYNISLWPNLIPLGLILTFLALRKSQIRFAVLASPFLSPFVALTSFSITLLGLLPSISELFVAVSGLWLVQIIGRWMIPVPW
jgi:hypothetical protein